MANTRHPQRGRHARNTARQTRPRHAGPGNRRGRIIGSDARPTTRTTLLTQQVRRTALMAVLCAIMLAVVTAWRIMPATALATPAAAATTRAQTTSGLTLRAGENLTLAGHSFTATLLGSYGNTQISGDTVASIEVRGSTASNAWISRAIAEVNGSLAQDRRITVPAGQDEAGTLARITDAALLRKLAGALAAASGKPAAAANRSTIEPSLHLPLADGLYLIEDSQGLPMILGTTIGGRHLAGQRLGEATIKAKGVEVGKHLIVDGEAKDSGSLAVGATAHWRIGFTLPHDGDGTTTAGRLIDSPKGQRYMSGSFAATLNDGTDVTRLIDVYEEGQTVPASTVVPGDTPVIVPAGGFGARLDRLIAAHPSRAVTISVQTIVTRTDDGRHPQQINGDFRYWDGTSTVTPPTTERIVDVDTFGFTLRKSAQSESTRLLDGAGFTLQEATTGIWLNRDPASGAWTRISSEADAQTRLTGDTNDDGLVDGQDDAGDRGVIRYAGLAAGSYIVRETKAPAGFSANALALPRLIVTISEDGTVTFRGDGMASGLVSTQGEQAGTVRVANVENLLQLPATGGSMSWGAWLAVSGLLISCAAWAGVVGIGRRCRADVAEHGGYDDDEQDDDEQDDDEQDDDEYDDGRAERIACTFAAVTGCSSSPFHGRAASGAWHARIMRSRRRARHAPQARTVVRQHT
ncbi:SpaA isopeptide-forming pilin-related protein [Bifidobacterium leontopitheci]|uniref:Collagen-binding protein n=1 Tax=Bifidobacterium leontopitheci TaxID=2650774 RepID=A0A6I1GHW4_9BIFI|nr:SpaA isopeptide-forming pilin-related protein [Bifidobacterium leontopitheci]KAB7791240.1 collagen-binding protein [Bifidobacterium leontopitheci]